MKSVSFASGNTYLEHALNSCVPTLSLRKMSAKKDPRKAMGLQITDGLPRQGGVILSVQGSDGQQTPRPLQSTSRTTARREVVNRILRMNELVSYIGMSRSAIYLLVKAGNFPRSISLGARAVGYLKNEIDEWIDSRGRTGMRAAGGTK